MGHAVEGTEAEYEVGGGDADDLAVGKELGEFVEGEAIFGVVEGGYEYQLVGDVEVGVAGGEALAVEEDGFGQGEFFDAEVAHFAEQSQVLFERFVVGVVFVVFAGDDDRVRICEAGEVVDVAVGVVAGDAVFQPEGLVSA